MKMFQCLAPVTCLLLFSALLPSTALTTATDACAEIGVAFQAGKVVPIKSALACVYSFPYDSGRSAAIMDTVYKTFQLYTYKDISIKSPTPEFDVNIDILGSLSKINSTTYFNDFEFNYALSSVINALNDGYAGIYTQCYVYTLKSYMAFPLVKIRNPSGTGEVVKISSFAGTVLPKIVSATEEHLKLKVASYAGATLLKINNENPVTYIERFAKRGGGYRDLNARINQAYYRLFADGSTIIGTMMGLNILSAPRLPSIKFKLIRKGSRRPETIHVPYFVNLLSGQNFTSATDYFTKNCLSMPPPSAAAAATSASVDSHVRTSNLIMSKMAAPEAHSIRDHIPSNLQPHLQQFDVLKKGRRGRHMKALGSPSDYNKAFILADRKTGVLYIPDMVGPDSNFSKWSQDIYNGISEIKAAGGTRLILDVQDNYGGYDLAYPLLEYLFPGIANAQYPMQNPATPLVIKMVQASIKDLEKSSSVFSTLSQYDWFGYGTNSSSPFYSSVGYFFPTTPLTYNGKTSQYSSLYSPVDRLAAPYSQDNLLLPFGDVTPQFEMNQTMILSNGGCVGSCSTFSYEMQEAGVKIISVGGSLGKPMAYSTGTVGYGYYLDALLTVDLMYLNLTNDAAAPQPLPVQAFLSYTAAQAFCRQSSTIPADFVFKPADHRLAFTSASVENVAALYNQAAKFFP